VKRSAKLPILVLGTAFAITLSGCGQDPQNADNCQPNSTNDSSCQRSGSGGRGRRGRHPALPSPRPPPPPPPPPTPTPTPPPTCYNRSTQLRRRRRPPQRRQRVDGAPRCVHRHSDAAKRRSGIQNIECDQRIRIPDPLPSPTASETCTVLILRACESLDFRD